jgi:ABC-type branched-subunit amino acid transport system substrate-binding protein
MAVFLIHLAWLTREQPIIKIGVSLPFSVDQSDANPMYDAVKQALASLPAGDGPRVNDHTREISHHTIELVPIDDSSMGGSGCAGGKRCPITAGGKHEDFTDITRDPRVAAIIGPFNSGVAVSEIPATTKAHIALISPAATADCLTNPRFAEGSCDVAKLGTGSYFRVATPDSVREKALADYLWSSWQEQHPATTPKVVIYEESGPKASTFSNSAGERFSEAWMQHTSVAPAIYPLADASSDDDVKVSLSKLTFTPDIILYAGTGSVGPKLYQAAAQLGLSNAIFAGPGSLENAEYAGYINHSPGGTLYAVDFAAVPSGDTNNAPNLSQFEEPKLYSAIAYDAAKISLLAIQRVLDDQKHSALDNVALRSRIALAARPLRLDVENSFRTQIVEKIAWLNTQAGGSIEYHGVTGTYSFNNNDADGAAGVTISTYVLASRTWKTVNLGLPSGGHP